MDNHIFLMCGNNYWPIDLDAIWSNYQQLNASVSTTVFFNRNSTGEYGFDNNVEVEITVWLLIIIRKGKQMTRTV